MLTIEINTDNDAFQDFKTEELERICQDIVRKIDRGDISGSCFDSNGNKVGKWLLDEDQN